jgi:hypothetical protein
LKAYFKRFLSLSFRGKILLAEAYFLQLIIGLSLKFIPFRYFHKLLKSNHDHSLLTPSNPGPYNNSTNSFLLRIRDSTLTAGRFTPWHNQCLVQSLAARSMLNRRKIPSKFYFGIIKENNKMKAHAWLLVGDYEIIAKNGEYTVVHEF